MGMSASQTRVLMLTARQNDLEYQAQQILQAKLAASRQAEDAAAAYEEKMSNTHFIKKEKQEDGVVQQNVTAYSIYESGYYLIDRAGNIVVPSGLDSSLFENCEEYGFETDSQLKNHTTVVPDLTKDKGGANSYLKEMLDKGEFTLCRRSNANDDPEDISHKETTMDATADFAEVYYTADDAEAESKYNSITKKLETLEKKLDMQMEQIETERSAVKTEKESVETVVKDNVESTFKTFG